MIQFNLLPNVKLEYIKATRRKRLVMTGASLMMAVALGITILLFLVVNVIQKQHLKALSNDINQGVKELQETPNLDKILTVQNQLMSLDGLHDQKPVASRLFGYLAQITPVEVSIAQLDVDFDQNTMRFTGSSDSLSSINKFVDTLKFTNYRLKGSDNAEESKNAFASVVLSSFNRNSQEANYTIDLVFDPVIFSITQEAELVVPSAVTTRSETEKPLFQPQQEEGQ